ncbi:cytidyltransferase-related domain protein [Pseudodesulfovibrio mercurii]|uniref:Cytidyltransferase-related domain protein n=1 Tax=Pseudodesulfovibrio mercurii TaxID=641491 RepID=F0JKT2_9BACT|nr:nicotinamide mononucleotide adenylyltransferase [Pseudodesulfovibrio mercurii]EGB16531.1 cytidyltransferase-related domain protein [Pseudodesulfovibrio mercurii]
MHPLGFIHGRFQVLHNDHLVYLLAGKALCDRLIIGVTNPDAATTRDEATNPARSSRENNPLTFEERKAMIEAALMEAGVDRHAFSVIPFPINCPELLEQRAPRDAVYFLTIYDDWGREKLRRFRELGLKTEVMWERPEREKGINGTAVRAAIRDGGEWRSLVPPAVAALVDRWHLAERFRHP